MRFYQLFGDTSSFAVSVALEDDPGPTHGMPEALRRSWGRLAIYANGRSLTQNVTDGRSSDAIHWYLGPFLAWLDAGAVRMLNEEPFPGVPVDGEVVDSMDWLETTLDGPPFTSTEEEEERWFDERSRWAERRVLRTGLSGAVAPFLAIRRLGDHVELSWDNEAHPPTRPHVRFIESRGAALVAADEVASVLRSVVQVVSREVDGPGAQRLHGPLANGVGPGADAWRWLIHPATRRLFDDRRLAAQRDELEGSVPATGALVPHTLTTALLRSVPAATVEQLEPFLRVRRPSGRLAQALVSARSAPAPNVKEAWAMGYERARRLRQDLGWGSDPAPKLEVAMSELGIDVEERELVSGVQCAVVGFGESRASAIISDGAGMGRSMRLGTALGHVLFDVQADHPFGAASSNWSHWPTNARAKAFGAMLLMPDAAVREMARHHGAVDASLVSAVMQRFGTGLAAATWHLYHLRLVSDEARLELVRQVRDSAE